MTTPQGRVHASDIQISDASKPFQTRGRWEAGGATLPTLDPEVCKPEGRLLVVESSHSPNPFPQLHALDVEGAERQVAKPFGKLLHKVGSE